MLTCPHCQTPVREDSPICPAPDCKFSLEGVQPLMGAVPLLNVGLTDLSYTLSDRGKRTLKVAIERFERELMPSNINVVINKFDPRYNLSIQLFWLFNSAGLAPPENRLTNNKDVMIGLDPELGRIGLIVGYGLEPYVSQEAITSVLKNTTPLLSEGEYSEALVQLIEHTKILLNNCSRISKEILGI